MVSDENLLNYPDYMTKFTVHTDTYDKQFGAVTRNNNKHIAFFYRILIKIQHNYTTMDK